MNETAATSESSLAATGIIGFDHIIGGGFTRNRLYLVEGNPGSGKTTLALQYLLEGARLGERGLYITLSETAEELRAVAASHGWSLDGIALFELTAGGGALDPDPIRGRSNSAKSPRGSPTRSSDSAPPGSPSTAFPS